MIIVAAEKLPLQLSGAMPCPLAKKYRVSRRTLVSLTHSPLPVVRRNLRSTRRAIPCRSALEGRTGPAFISDLDTTLPDALNREPGTGPGQSVLDSPDTQLQAASTTASLDACWEHWLEYIRSLEESQEMLETLQHRMELAAADERFADAAALKKEVELLQQEDSIKIMRQRLERAVREEDYQTAAQLRDGGLANLEGWWCGRAEGDLHGHLLHITPGFGRWVARLYTPRELADLKGWRDETSTTLFEYTEASLDKLGTPLFEVLVRPNGDGGLKSQTVALRRREEEVQQDVRAGETMLVGRFAVEVMDEDVEGAGELGEGQAGAQAAQLNGGGEDALKGFGPDRGTVGEENDGDVADVDGASSDVALSKGKDEDDGVGGSGEEHGHMGRNALQLALSLTQGVPIGGDSAVQSTFNEREQHEVEETLRALAEVSPPGEVGPSGAAGLVGTSGSGVVGGSDSNAVGAPFPGMLGRGGSAELSSAERLEALLAKTVPGPEDHLEEWVDGGRSSDGDFVSNWLRLPATLMPLGRDKFAFRVQEGREGDDRGWLGRGTGAVPGAPAAQVHVERAEEGKVEVVVALRGQEEAVHGMEDAFQRIVEAVVQLQELKSGSAVPKHTVRAAIQRVAEQVAEHGGSPWVPRPSSHPVDEDSVASSNPVLTYTRINTKPTKTDPYSGLFLGAFGGHGPELLQLERRIEDGEEYVVGVKLTGDSHVPAGEISFRAKVGRQHKLDSKAVYPEELGVMARYRGEGRIAASGFKNAKWVDGELLQLTNTPLTGGAELGFVWAVPGEKRFLILFNRIELD